MCFATQVEEDDPSFLVSAPAQKKKKTKHCSLAYDSDEDSILIPEEM